MAEPSPALTSPCVPGTIVDDEHLLSRHLAGDPRAFGELVDLLGGPVLGWLRRSGVPPQDAEELLQEVWGYGPGVQTRTIDTTVRTLRSKLESGGPRFLLTERGVGYRF